MDTTSQTITTSQIVLSILGSGAFTAIVSGMINFIGNKKRQTRQLKIEYLEKQLNSFYGPLSFYCGQNKALIKHREIVSKLIFEAWPVDEFRPEDRKEALEEFKKDFAAHNVYYDETIKNNEVLFEILNKNWSLPDLEDQELFSNFQLSVIRMKTEFDEKKKWKYSQRVSIDMPLVTFCDTKFVDGIQKAFEDKKQQLKGLQAE